MAVTHTDYLQQVVGAGLSPVVGVWVRLLNNSTATNYYSTAPTIATGAFTHSAPPGDYSLYTGNAATVPATPTLQNGHYSVPVTAGDDVAASSYTALPSSPYAPSAVAGSVNNIVYCAAPTGTPATDTSNINAAVNNAGINGTVIFGKGTYKANTFIGPNSQNYQTWQGWGSTIQCDATNASGFVVANTAAAQPNNPLVGWVVYGLTIDANNVANTVAFGLFSVQLCSFYNATLKNVTGGTTAALRLEAPGTVNAQIGPLYSNSTSNYFVGLIIAGAPIGIRITGAAVATAVTTLTTFVRTLGYNLTAVGLDIIQNCDTNYCYDTDLVFSANNAIGIRINTGPSAATQDNDAKNLLFDGVSFTASPSGNTGFTGFYLNWTAGNWYNRIWVDPSFTAPTRFNDVADRASVRWDATTLPSLFMLKNIILQLNSADSYVDFTAVANAFGTNTPGGTGLGDKIPLYAGAFGFGVQSGALVAYVGGTAAGFEVRQNAGGAGQQSAGTSAWRLDGAGHLTAAITGTPATSALGANVTSVTFTGNDRRGTIAIVMSGALARNTRIATCTFSISYGAASPQIFFFNQTSGNLALVNLFKLAFATGVSFDIASDQALAAGTYTFGYIVEA